MPSKIEEPKVEARPMSPGDGNLRYTHPAFGQFKACKVQGRTNLYGSDFTHQSFISLEVSTSELNRNLSHDWYFAKETILQFDMSEAQWATFVSSFNTEGVPVTLRYVTGDPDYSRPQLPDPDIRREFSKEVEQTMFDSLERLRALQDTIRNSNMGKGLQKTIGDEIRMAIQEIESNLPFVKESFDKHVEDSIERAKVEVNAYATNTIMRAGLEAIQGNTPLLGYDDAKSD